MILDTLAERMELEPRQVASDSIWVKGHLGEKSLFLAKPMTFVNSSGRAIKALLASLELAPAELVIIHDDLDLPLGTLRLKQGGSSGGHRGVESAIIALNTEDFGRLRVGIGRPPGRQDPAVYVLRPFTKKQWPEISLAAERAADGLEAMIKEGMPRAMEQVNRDFGGPDH